MRTIREPTLADVDALARVHVRAWQVGYRGMMPDAFLDALRPEPRAERWRKHLTEGLGADKRLLVLFEHDALLGMAGLGPDRGSLGCGELYMINVDPDAWGRGVGRALLKHAERALAELGHRKAILWVVSANERARRFYEKAGWAFSGVTSDNEIAENGISFVCNESRYDLALGQGVPNNG